GREAHRRRSQYRAASGIEIRESRSATIRSRNLAASVGRDVSKAGIQERRQIAPWQSVDGAKAVKPRRPLFPQVNPKPNGLVQRKAPAAPNVYRPQPVPKVLQTKQAQTPPKPVAPPVRPKPNQHNVQLKPSASRV